MLKGFVKSGVSSSKVAPKTFDPKYDFMLGVGDPVRKYESGLRATKGNVHFGQFKLAVVEILFFTKWWDHNKVPNPTVVYVGSANGIHIAVLADMFPKFTWHLHDPRDHSRVVEDHPRITTHKGYFDDNEAQTYAGRDDIIFLSDIRGEEGKDFSLSEDATPEEIKEYVKIHQANMDAQMKWVQIINPHIASLKMRFPYSWAALKEDSTKRTYLTGQVMKQPWAPKSSTETRLIISDQDRHSGNHGVKDLKASGAGSADDGVHVDVGHGAERDNGDPDGAHRRPGSHRS